MKFKCLYFFLPFIAVLLYSNVYAQKHNNSFENDTNKRYFIAVKTGIQMSGIKDEDFVSNNLAPLINISIGKWIVPSVGLQFAYKGLYFNTISDKEKHYYSFYYGEVLFNINSVFTNKFSRNTSKNNFHIGSGYFYNYYYHRPNICASMGISSSLTLNSKFDINVEMSAIMGWDIYQGDDDIIPNLSLGIIYKL